MFTLLFNDHKARKIIFLYNYPFNYKHNININSYKKLIIIFYFIKKTKNYHNLILIQLILYYVFLLYSK